MKKETMEPVNLGKIGYEAFRERMQDKGESQ